MTPELAPEEIVRQQEQAVIIELARQEADSAAREMIEAEEAARLPSEEELAQEAEWEAIIQQANIEAEELRVQKAKDAEDFAKATGLEPDAVRRLLGA